jgi:proteasome lid subunit RPN8/RPN11
MNAIDAIMNDVDASLSYKREVSCFIIPEHGIISSTTNNSSASVEFDWFTVKDRIWKLKENGQCPNYICMIHTHPPYLNRMSGIDRNMVYGWCMALDIPILFIVLTEDDFVAYRCELRNKKVKIEIISLSEDYMFNMRDAIMVWEIMYGLSKSEFLTNEDLDSVTTEINSSKIDFKKIVNPLMNDIEENNLTEEQRKQIDEVIKESLEDFTIEESN